VPIYLTVPWQLHNCFNFFSTEFKKKGQQIIKIKSNSKFIYFNLSFIDFHPYKILLNPTRDTFFGTVLFCISSSIKMTSVHLGSSSSIALFYSLFISVFIFYCITLLKITFIKCSSTHNGFVIDFFRYFFSRTCLV
jgi:hypothetical protein